MATLTFPSLNTITAAMTCPQTSSGTPTTAQSKTASCESSCRSMSKALRQKRHYQFQKNEFLSNKTNKFATDNVNCPFNAEFEYCNQVIFVE